MRLHPVGIGLFLRCFMTQSHIVRLAQCYKNCRDYNIYEALKRKAQKLNLKAMDYELLILKLAKVLGI
jgi:hypothetical protein